MIDIGWWPTVNAAGITTGAAALAFTHHASATQVGITIRRPRASSPTTALEKR